MSQHYYSYAQIRRPTTQQLIYPKSASGPRKNPLPVNALALLGVDLHDQMDPERSVANNEVEVMQKKLTEHSEETNELFNLMARQIKKRTEERVNMVVIEDKSQA